MQAKENYKNIVRKKRRAYVFKHCKKIGTLKKSKPRDFGDSLNVQNQYQIYFESVYAGGNQGLNDEAENFNRTHD